MEISFLCHYVVTRARGVEVVSQQLDIWPIITTLVRLPIYFVCNYQTFTRHSSVTYYVIRISWISLCGSFRVGFNQYQSDLSLWWHHSCNWLISYMYHWTNPLAVDYIISLGSISILNKHVLISVVLVNYMYN